MYICSASDIRIDMVRTGQNILTYRKANHIKVSELQEIFGFEYPQAIYNWQKGKCLPSVDNLLVLAKLFGVHMDDLLAYDQEVAFFLLIFRNRCVFLSPEFQCSAR